MGKALHPDFMNISTVGTPRLPVTGIEQWDEEGVLHLKKIIPDDLIAEYIEERKKTLGDTPKWRPGWNSPTPYLWCPAMKKLALYRPLTEAIRPLINNTEPGLHLCLTGFQSTERAWHADEYLNPEGVNYNYIAAWIVLDDVHPDSGPFQYAVGSHRWPSIQREKVWAGMRSRGENPNLPTWPSDSQGWVGDACASEIAVRKTEIRDFLGKKGDVLLWSYSLIHRGSVPKDRSLERRALICHYSGIRSRPDMLPPVQESNGSWFFDFPHNQEPGQSTHRPAT